MPYFRQVTDVMRIFQHNRNATNKGASQIIIERNTFLYKYKRGGADEKCTICLSEFEDAEDVRYAKKAFYSVECFFHESLFFRRLPCMHLFHVGCVDQWLDTNKRCPICRVDIEEKLKGTEPS